MKKIKQKHPSQRGVRISIVSIIVNLFLAIIKWTGGYIGNSYALIADAFESLTDVASSIVVLTGLKVSAKVPDQDHPYGHGKAEPIAGLIVSVFLLFASVMIALQSIYNIRTPHESPEPFTLIILGLVIGTKETLFKKLTIVGESTGSHALKSDAWHQRADALTSIGAFIGILIALIAGKGYESADDWAALVTSVFIAVNAFRIGKPALEEIMDTAPRGEIVDLIRKKAAETEGVKAIDKCLVRKMGFDYYIDIHIVVDGNLSVSKGHEIAHKVKDKLLASDLRIQGAIVHVEPFNPDFT
jgi:cation diffusion facilitator family transporter